MSENDPQPVRVGDLVQVVLPRTDKTNHLLVSGHLVTVQVTADGAELSADQCPGGRAQTLTDAETGITRDGDTLTVPALPVALVRVWRDGEPLSVPMTKNAAYRWLLKHQGQSWDYALTHGGYSVRPHTL